MNKLTVLILVLGLGFSLSCQDPAINLAAQNKEMVSKAFEVVGSGDFENMGNYIADNYVRHSQATPDLKVSSLDDFKEFIRADRVAVPDQYLEIDHLVAEGDYVAFYATYHGTQTGQMGPFPPTGKKVALKFAGVHRVSEGKIAETWITWDNISFLSQLGHFPPSQTQEPPAEEVE